MSTAGRTVPAVVERVQTDDQGRVLYVWCRSLAENGDAPNLLQGGLRPGWEFHGRPEPGVRGTAVYISTGSRGYWRFHEGEA